MRPSHGAKSQDAEDEYSALEVYEQEQLLAEEDEVSFTDPTGITHAVEVSASSLFEAAALAVAEFRRWGFADVALGAATSLAVTVKPPATTHELRVSKLEAWLNSAGKSPGEQALKVRLKEELERVR